MRFWDASAVVPLICEETASSKTVQLYQEDRQVLVWTLTVAEVISALCRKLREGSLDRQLFRSCRRSLQLLSEDWKEVQVIDLVRERAHRLLETHPLRAADALQLGAALVATEDQPNGFGFITCDELLGTAAEKEGFAVLP
ncbi:MAG TPA: type II toxin-antitoxin system VapC family toxin [Acidobacteriota bacterium]|jgi:hypothetical protein